MPLTLEGVTDLFRQFTRDHRCTLEVILLGGLAMQHYGMGERSTLDVDAEVRGPLEELLLFFKKRGVPADFGEDVSRWSVISMPPGFRRRAPTIYKDARLRLKVLSALDFVIAKLRRFTDEDINDALFVAEKYGLAPEEIERAMRKAIKSSPKDTVLFNFERNTRYFVEKLYKKRLKLKK